MATKKLELTRLGLDNLLPAERGQRYEMADTIVAGLRVRVTDVAVDAGRFKGKAAHISFIVVARFQSDANPTRRTIGRYERDGGGVTIQDARDKARAWKRKIADGIDPAAEIRRQREAEESARLESESQRRAEDEAIRNRKSLKDLLDTYEEEALTKLKRGAATRRALDGKMGLLKAFIERDPTTLTRSEIVLVLKQRAKVAPMSANRQLAYASAFFNWCVGEELLTVNPVEKVKKPSKENVRDRHHSLAELSEIWAATASFEYPFKQLYRLLIVLPMRREEVAALLISELDLASDKASNDAVWILPSGRTKRANALRVPLSGLARSLIKEAISHSDRPKESEFVFTTTGKTSVSGFSKAKKRLDATIHVARAKVAAEQGEKIVPMPHWTLHDLRTTFNTLACDVLGIDANVADRILNHVATATTSNVMRIYNRSELFEPRKKALNDWAMLLEVDVVGNGRADSPAP